MKILECDRGEVLTKQTDGTALASNKRNETERALGTRRGCPLGPWRPLPAFPGSGLSRGTQVWPRGHAQPAV